MAPLPRCPREWLRSGDLQFGAIKSRCRGAGQGGATWFQAARRLRQVLLQADLDPLIPSPDDSLLRPSGPHPAVQCEEPLLEQSREHGWEEPEWRPNPWGVAVNPGARDWGLLEWVELPKPGPGAEEGA